MSRGEKRACQRLGGTARISDLDGWYSKMIEPSNKNGVGVMHVSMTSCCGLQQQLVSYVNASNGVGIRPARK